MLYTWQWNRSHSLLYGVFLSNWYALTACQYAQISLLSASYPVAPPTTTHTHTHARAFNILYSNIYDIYMYMCTCIVHTHGWQLKVIWHQIILMDFFFFAAAIFCAFVDEGTKYNNNIIIMLLAVKCIVDWSHIQTHKWAACITKARGQRVVRTRRENKTGQNKNQQHSREKEKYTENVPPNWIPALHDLWLHFVCCCHGFACAECWCFRFFFFCIFVESVGRRWHAVPAARKYTRKYIAFITESNGITIGIISHIRGVLGENSEYV